MDEVFILYLQLINGYWNCKSSFEIWKFMMTMDDPKCPECAGKIQLGIAIRPEAEYGARYCLGNPPPITHKTMEIIPVYKYMSCGYSCDDDRDLLWKND